MALKTARSVRINRESRAALMSILSFTEYENGDGFCDAL
jgi:hypothetical protein